MDNELNELIQLVLEKDSLMDVQTLNHKSQLEQQGIQLEQKDSQLEQNKSQILHYKQLVAQLQRMLFGTKSEKFKQEPVDPSQLALSFEELAAKSANSESEETVKEKKDSEPKKKNHPGRHKLLDNLPEDIIVLIPRFYTRT